MKETDYLDVKEAALVLHVLPATVQRWLKAGKIDSIQPGRKRLIPRSALETYLNGLSGAPKDR